MAQVMISELIAVFISELFQMLRDRLVVLRYNEVSLALMRNRLNQPDQILRNHQLPRGRIGLVDFAYHIIAAEPELAALNRQHIAFQIAELQAANFADSQGEPDCKQTRQLDIRTAHHLNNLLRRGQILNLRLFRRKRDIQLQLDAVEFQRCDDQILSFVDRLAAELDRVLVDCFLHCEAVNLMNVHRHQTLQPVPANDAVPVNRRGRQHIAFEIHVAVNRLPDREPFQILLAGQLKFRCELFRFFARRSAKGLHDVFAVRVFPDEYLNPPVSGRKFLCFCHSILLFSIRCIRRHPTIVYTFSAKK